MAEQPVLTDQLTSPAKLERRNQTTLGEPVRFEGTGLHTGAAASVTMKPAGPDQGVVFIRTDLPGSPSIKAHPDHVVRTVKCTTLGVAGGAEVQTTEHLMAAIGGLGLDNVVVEIAGPEVPTGDGSAAFFARSILAGGIQELAAPRRYLTIEQPVYVSHGDMVMVAVPADQLKLSYVFTNAHPAIGNLFAEYVVEPETFLREIAPARTLAFTREIEEMRRLGLAMGGSLDTVVVIDETGYVNERRFPDEVVRHKILDLLGDISLLGPLKAHIVGLRSGHAANAALSAAVFKAATSGARG